MLFSIPNTANNTAGEALASPGQQGDSCTSSDAEPALKSRRRKAYAHIHVKRIAASSDHPSATAISGAIKTTNMGHIRSLAISARLIKGETVRCFAWEKIPGGNGATELMEQERLSYDAACALAERGLLYGVGDAGSTRPPRHVIAQCDVDDIAKAIKDAQPMGGKASITSAASRTVHHESINGARITFKAYRHTGRRAWAPNLRADYR